MPGTTSSTTAPFLLAASGPAPLAGLPAPPMVAAARPRGARGSETSMPGPSDGATGVKSGPPGVSGPNIIGDGIGATAGGYGIPGYAAPGYGAPGGGPY